MSPRIPSVSHTKELAMTTSRLPSLFSADPFDEAFRGFLRPWRWEVAAETPQIRLDVDETDTAYTVNAEIPGVRKEDINVNIAGNQVSISAEVKKDSEEKKDGRLLRSERSYGFVSRSFSLAAEVDDAKAGAKYKDGVLTLTLPKKATSRTERLRIE
jgi:HSP20 family protein